MARLPNLSGILALGLGTLLLVAPLGIAPTLAVKSIDIFWVIHEHGPDCRGQHVLLNWEVRGDPGWYRVTVTGTNVVGVEHHPIDYDSGPVDVTDGNHAVNGVHAYDSECFPTVGDESHGKSVDTIGTLFGCGPTELGCNPGAAERTDEALCHWGHDAHCGEFSGD